MSNAPTLWAYPEKKFRPRNKQAAMICIKAKPIHLPPEEVKEPVFALTQAQIVEAESKARRKKIEMLEAENAVRIEQQKATQKERRAEERRKQEAAKPKNMWAARYLRKMAKISGRPKPTTEELRAARNASHLIGTPAFVHAMKKVGGGGVEPGDENPCSISRQQPDSPKCGAVESSSPAGNEGRLTARAPSADSATDIQ